MNIFKEVKVYNHVIHRLQRIVHSLCRTTEQQVHQTLHTGMSGLSNVWVQPGGGCTGAVYLSILHSCCSYRVMNCQQIRKSKTLLLNKQKLLDRTIIISI